MGKPLKSKIRIQPLPEAARTRLPAIRGETSLAVFKPANRNAQIVQEFRSKLRTIEEMIGKLAFNLREIQGMRKRRASSEPKPLRLGRVLRVKPQG